ncbi:MAG TPA: integrase arm-type DNA-binding domain-containing protein [Stellaceae bacterium]|nr:integrase arm-type DNA-binding domain-containing protein [Stellaceae bacterium]
MAKTTEKLTAGMVEKLKGVPGKHADGAGLYLQVQGSASWILRYQFRGKERYLGLGPLSVIDLAEARARALDARRQIFDGIDPVAAKAASLISQKREEAKSVTFEEATKAYFVAKRSDWSNAKHKWQVERNVEMYAAPILNPLLVSEIETKHVMQVLEPIWKTLDVTARRLRGRIEDILNYGITITSGHFKEGKNPATWNGHLEHVLTKNRKKVVHQAAMPWREISGFMAKLREHTAPSARALEFTVLTAVRTSETIGAVAGEFDLDAAVWVIPQERMKMDIEHRVPLAPRVIEILKALGIRDRKPSDRLFPFSDAAMRRLLQVDMGHREATIHGMRSAFRDWAEEQTSFPSRDVERCLAHKVNNAVESAYQRSAAVERRRPIMNTWADYCAQPAPEGRIVQLRRVG